MQIDRRQKPIAVNQTNFVPPAFKKIFLSNGLHLYLIKKDELPIIRLSFVIEGGSKFDKVRKYGTSNLTSMCIDEGAGDLNALQLADEFELIGARFNINSGSDVTIISLQVLSENFFRAIELLTSVIISPHFNESDFAREKRKIQTRVEQLKDEPDQIADIAFEYLLLGKNNPYSFPVIGTKDSLKEINVADVKSFYADFFNAGNTTIIAAGSFNEDEIIFSLEEKLKGWRAEKKPSLKLLPAEKKNRKIYLIPRNDSVQTEIRLGHSASKRNENDYFKKLLLNLVLGGQFSSRLNFNLREKNGFTYGINSRFHYYKDDAYFIVSTSVNTENTQNALREILRELENIRNGITEEEIKFAQSSIIRRFPLNFETCAHIASNFESKVIYNLPDDYFNTYIRKISEVSLDELNAVAAKSIDADNVTIVLVGDEKSVIPQIKDGGLGEIIKINFEELYSINR